MKAHAIPTITAAQFCVSFANFARALKDKDSVAAAGFSRSFNHCECPVQADGSPTVQTYVVAKGSCAPGLGACSENIWQKQGYYPAKDARKADLMLVVHGGKTVPFDCEAHQNIMHEGLRGLDIVQQMGFRVGAASELQLRTGGQGQSPDLGAVELVHSTRDGPSLREPLAQVKSALIAEAGDQKIEGVIDVQFAPRMRDAADERNANLPGSTAELKHRDNPSLCAGAGAAYQDLFSDIESARCYVAVTDCDFQESLQRKHKRGLWRAATRIAARGNHSDEKLGPMVDKALSHLARDSGGHLVRQLDYTSRVSVGEFKVYGVWMKNNHRRIERDCLMSGFPSL